MTWHDILEILKGLVLVALACIFAFAPFALEESPPEPEKKSSTD